MADAFEGFLDGLLLGGFLALEILTDLALELGFRRSGRGGRREQEAGKSDEQEEAGQSQKDGRATGRFFRVHGEDDIRYVYACKLRVSQILQGARVTPLCKGMSKSDWKITYRSYTSAELDAEIEKLKKSLDGGYVQQGSGSVSGARDVGELRDRLTAATEVKNARGGRQQPGRTAKADFSGARMEDF